MTSNSELSIILTDDDPHFQFFLNHVLDGMSIPHQITVLKGGDQLIDHLAKSDDKKCSCILLDMNMPRKNGIDTLKEMRAKKLGDGIPVIVISLTPAEAYEREVNALGASYLEKPFGLAEFKSFVKKVTELLPGAVS